MDIAELGSFDRLVLHVERYCMCCQQSTDQFALGDQIVMDVNQRKIDDQFRLARYGIAGFAMVLYEVGD